MAFILKKAGSKAHFHFGYFRGPGRSEVMRAVKVLRLGLVRVKPV